MEFEVLWWKRGQVKDLDRAPGPDTPLAGDGDSARGCNGQDGANDDHSNWSHMFEEFGYVRGLLSTSGCLVEWTALSCVSMIIPL